jgi:hypothetical protein
LFLLTAAFASLLLFLELESRVLTVALTPTAVTTNSGANFLPQGHLLFFAQLGNIAAIGLTIAITTLSFLLSFMLPYCCLDA